jgi:hypothetical protein
MSAAIPDPMLLFHFKSYVNAISQSFGSVCCYTSSSALICHSIFFFPFTLASLYAKLSLNLVQTLVSKFRCQRSHFQYFPIPSHLRQSGTLVQVCKSSLLNIGWVSTAHPCRNSIHPVSLVHGRYPGKRSEQPLYACPSTRCQATAPPSSEASILLLRTKATLSWSLQRVSWQDDL